MSLRANDPSVMSALNTKQNQEMQRLIVWHRATKLGKPPSKARIVAVDGSGITIEYRIVTSLLSNPSGEKKTLRVPFTPADAENVTDARSQFNQLAREAAKQKLPSKSYRVTYSVPRDLPMWIGLNMLMLLISQPEVFTAIANRSPVSLAPVAALLDAIRARLPNGAQSMAWLYRWILIAHAGEASAMGLLAYSRGARGLTWLKWVLTHFTIGFTTFWSFRALNPSIPASV